jgi:hypothetical protein
VHPFECVRCLALANDLVEVTSRRDEAVLRMRSLVGLQKPEEFAVALRESESLHMECQAIRAELDRHRADHGQIAIQF